MLAVLQVRCKDPVMAQQHVLLIHLDTADMAAVSEPEK